MLNVNRYCYACMGLLTEENGVCPHCGHDNRIRYQDDDCLPGTVLQGQYLVGKPLGRGGFGVTYLAMDMALERKVAIKEFYPSSMAIRTGDGYTMRSRTGSEGEYTHGCERALEEGRVGARMGQVPGVVQIYSAFEANGTVYIVMEYVEGRTLTQTVQSAGGCMSWQQLITLMEPIMRTLSTIHGMKVIHRDVSPDNIMIRPDGTAVLLDFGAAHSISDRTMSEHSVSLRLGYAPIEQYASTSKQDGRIDEYALCATMYYVLTGKRPADATERAFGGTNLPSPRALGADIPAYADAALMKGMSVKADDRYASVNDLRLAMTGHQAKRGGAKGLIIALTAALVLALGAAGVFLLQPDKQSEKLVEPTATVTATETVQPTEAATPAPAPVKVPVYMMHGNTLLDEKTVLLMPGQPLTLDPADYVPKGYLLANSDRVTVTMNDDGAAQPDYVTFEYVTPTPVPTATPSPTPTPTPTATPEPENILGIHYDDVEIGDHLFFGHYEQDAVESNGKEPIEWRVLDKQDGRVLVISEYGLDCQLYHKERKKITWEESSLRTWLNSNFLNAAFTQAEQDAIPTVRVAYDQADEAYTLDQVFLLSADEAKTYFKSDADRRCDTTAYADKQGVRKWGEGYAYWPLRAYGSSQYAGGCDASGKVHGMGNTVNDDVNAVRPAMWIKLK